MLTFLTQSDFATTKDSASTTALDPFLKSPHLKTTSSLKDSQTSHTSHSVAALLGCLGDKEMPGWLRGTAEQQSLLRAPGHPAAGAESLEQQVALKVQGNVNGVNTTEQDTGLILQHPDSTIRLHIQHVTHY